MADNKKKHNLFEKQFLILFGALTLIFISNLQIMMI